jgi:hypothetical protein
LRRDQARPTINPAQRWLPLQRAINLLLHPFLAATCRSTFKLPFVPRARFLLPGVPQLAVKVVCHTPLFLYHLRPLTQVLAAAI